MARVSFEVPPIQKLVLVEQAKSLGVSLATYARNLVVDGAKRDKQGHQAEQLRAIRALVPIMVLLFSHTRNLAPELTQRWMQAMLERYEKERIKP